MTHEQLQSKAEKYSRGTLTVGERDDVLKLLNNAYILGFKQGYTVAGGVVSAAEAAKQGGETDET